MALAWVIAASIPQNKENKQFAVGFGSSFTFVSLEGMEEISHSTAVLHTVQRALWNTATTTAPGSNQDQDFIYTAEPQLKTEIQQLQLIGITRGRKGNTSKFHWMCLKIVIPESTECSPKNALSNRLKPAWVFCTMRFFFGSKGARAQMLPRREVISVVVVGYEKSPAPQW